MNLEKILQTKAQQRADSAPMLFDLSKLDQKQVLTKLLAKKQVRWVVDDYREQLKEHYQISNPQVGNPQIFEKNFVGHLNILTKKNSLPLQGKWVYYPWLETLVHILKENDFFALRSARNKQLITNEEQKKFYNAKVGIGGLSVGSSVAVAIVLQGGAKHMRLADFDSLSLSNTNRIRAGVQNLGLSKVTVTARQIYEINPYAKVEIFSEGLTPENIKKFMAGLDIMVDEMDSLSAKFLIRTVAKKLKIPVLMGADNADMAVIDIERYDKNPAPAFFHGRIEKPDYKKLLNMGKFETGKTIARLVGLENHTERMLLSLQEMGKSVVSWPQLGGTAMLNGAAIAYCVRKITAGQNLNNGRGIISLDEKLTDGYFSKTQKKSREKAIGQFKKIFNL